MNTLICAFSSDNRQLYQADIYRVLSLPLGQIIHFRYSKEIVNEHILSDYNNLISKKVAIFYTSGNTDEIRKENPEGTLNHTSIRWAKITNIEISPETEVFHVYMELLEFCEVQIIPENLSEHQPLSNFFTLLNCKIIDNSCSWNSRINSIKDCFTEMTFINLKGIYDKDNKLIKPRFDKRRKKSTYTLIQGNTYTLKLAASNPKSTNTKIDISENTKDIQFNCLNPYESSIDFDDQEIDFHINNLQTFKKISIFNFKPITDQNSDNLNEYSTNIEVALRIGFLRPFVFGVLSTMLFSSIFLATSIGEDDGITSKLPSISDLNLLVACAIVFLISSGSLFLWFNKK